MSLIQNEGFVQFKMVASWASNAALSRVVVYFEKTSVWVGIFDFPDCVGGFLGGCFVVNCVFEKHQEMFTVCLFDVIDREKEVKTKLVERCLCCVARLCEECVCATLPVKSTELFAARR